MICKEKERSKIMVVRMDNTQRLLGISRIDSGLELCGMKKGVDKKMDEIILRLFGNIEKRMENIKITKRAYRVYSSEKTRKVNRISE